MSDSASHGVLLFCGLLGSVALCRAATDHGQAQAGVIDIELVQVHSPSLAANSPTPKDDACKASDLRQTLLLSANRKIAERRAWLSKEHAEHTAFGELRAPEMWYMFTPDLPCFWTFEKEPSSAVLHEGGKWLCGLQEVHQMRAEANVRYGVGNHYEKKCVVYSMGSKNQFDFEERVRAVGSGCEIHTFDPTVKETRLGTPFYDAYHGDYGLGGADGKRNGFEAKSLTTIMRELRHSHVDYLKLDLQGDEWSFFHWVDWKSAKVGQILVELCPNKKANLTARAMNEVFNKLEGAGYRLISLEPVTKSNFGQVEAVFMHKDWHPSGAW